MDTRVRHRAAPNPDGCRWCGDDQGNHGSQWIASHGMHQWEQPTRAQRLARMHARRNAARTARTTKEPRMTRTANKGTHIASLPAHTMTITTIANGKDLDWTHPANCPEPENTCEFMRRINRMGHDMADLAEGRPDGTYRLAGFGFHSIRLIEGQA